MIIFEKLRKNHSAFRSLTGYCPEQFTALYAEFAPAHEVRRLAATTNKRTGEPRQRAVGAGAKYHHDLRTRLLICLVWARIYPTYALLGFFFSLDKTNAEDIVKDMLATLLTLAHFPFELPSEIGRAHV